MSRRKKLAGDIREQKENCWTNLVTFAQSPRERYNLKMRNLRDLLIGPPIPAKYLADARIGNIRALAALSPDALSSIAYANQEIFLGLVVAGAAGLALSWVIALAITVLLAALSLSYMQTISAYPNGGGSYTVARENLGVNWGLVAAAALMTDYVLNVAVSVTAGTAAAASAFPDLWPYRTVMSVVLLLIVTVANLRGLRESGAFMTVPVFFFLSMFLAMIAAGIVRAIGDGPGSLMTNAPPATASLTLFLVMHTFAAGCTALTGVESISNGVPIFKRPEPKHARQTMVTMAILMGVLFTGTTGLTQYLAIVAGPQETILSALARRIWGSGLLYLLVQASSLLVLMVAANTSFVGFPRVASLVARDGYLPRQLAFLGDRLVYSNGIMLLAGLAAALVLIFEGDTHLLIPLFAVGAFLAFTLSQAGMVLHWVRQRGVNWRLKAILNGFGMTSTAVALSVIGLSKFLDGAWLVVLLIPVVVLGFRRIRRHYDEVTVELALSGLPPSLRPLPHPRIVLPIANLHRGVIKALRYARAISDDVTAIYVEVEPGSGDKLREQWEAWGCSEGARLEIVPSPYRSVLHPLMDFLDRTDREHNDGQLATVLLTDLVPAHWWEALLHNQTTWIIKLALLYRQRSFDKTRAIIDVPFYLRE